MKEEFELDACNLDIQGGYHGHPYPQKFVRAPLSKHPSPAPESGKKMPHSESMKICMGK